MNIVVFVDGCDFDDGCDRFITKWTFGQTPFPYLVVLVVTKTQLD